MIKLPITVILATLNEEVNIVRCLAALRRAERVLVVDSGSSDRTVATAEAMGAEVVRFNYDGRGPKKRQWALEHCDIRTPWVMVVDADEVITEALWGEIEARLRQNRHTAGFLATKWYWFLGRRFRWGGFSFRAMLLFRTGRARYERLLETEPEHFCDMEVHERVICAGAVGYLRNPIEHDDLKNLSAYRQRHERYAEWEALVRFNAWKRGHYGLDAIEPRFWGNSQERRRWLKRWVVRCPFEPAIWFLYHYIFRLGILEGRRGLLACRIRAQYIARVGALMRDLRAREAGSLGPTAPSDQRNGA